MPNYVFSQPVRPSIEDSSVPIPVLLALIFALVFGLFLAIFFCPEMDTELWDVQFVRRTRKRSGKTSAPKQSTTGTLDEEESDTGEEEEDDDGEDEEVDDDDDEEEEGDHDKEEENDGENSNTPIEEQSEGWLEDCSRPFFALLKDGGWFANNNNRIDRSAQLRGEKKQKDRKPSNTSASDHLHKCRGASSGPNRPKQCVTWKDQPPKRTYPTGKSKSRAMGLSRKYGTLNVHGDVTRIPVRILPGFFEARLERRRGNSYGLVLDRFVSDVSCCCSRGCLRERGFTRRFDDEFSLEIDRNQAQILVLQLTRHTRNLEVMNDNLTKLINRWKTDSEDYKDCRRCEPDEALPVTPDPDFLTHRACQTLCCWNDLRTKPCGVKLGHQCTCGLNPDQRNMEPAQRRVEPLQAPDANEAKTTRTQCIYPQLTDVSGTSVPVPMTSGKCGPTASNPYDPVGCRDN